MKTFKYVGGMTEEEITEQVKDLIQYMKTDEYWLERGGNGPYWRANEAIFRNNGQERGGTNRHTNCAI